MFLEERLKYYFKNFYEAALINAVLDFKLEPNLQLIDLKLKALKDFLNSTEGDNLLIAYKRASNIIGKQKLLGQINVANFVSEHENSLFNFITDNSSKIELMLAKKDYIGSLKLLAEMKLPISNFFDNVMVKDSNPVIANNRLLLLDKTRHIFDKIAKFDYL